MWEHLMRLNASSQVSWHDCWLQWFLGIVEDKIFIPGVEGFAEACVEFMVKIRQATKEALAEGRTAWEERCE
jgi:hypothetical protein